MNDISNNWPTTAEDEVYWQKIRQEFMLDPEEIYLNTGSFGSQPKAVFQHMIEALREIEKNPTHKRGLFQKREEDSKRELAAFLHVPVEDLAFTTNVTMSMNMVIHGLQWQPGDEILASDQEYGAVDNCLHHAEGRFGVTVRRANIPIPPRTAQEVVDAFEAALTTRTRLLLCSHIVSRTGLITPARELARLARDHGAMIAFDGAHAPGMIPLDISSIGCDFYGGNCHKWLCAPKGTGFLYASPEVQNRLQHVVVSWGYNRDGTEKADDGRLTINGSPFMWGIEKWGTRDQACFCAVGAAVRFQEEIGRDRVLSRGKQLARYLRERMSASGWSRLITPDAQEMSGSLSAFHLEGFGDLDLRARGITAPLAKDGKVHWMRVSTHICNGFDEIDRLMEVLSDLRPLRG